MFKLCKSERPELCDLTLPPTSRCLCFKNSRGLFGLLLTQNSSKSLGVALSFDLSLYSLSSPTLALVSH